MSEQLCIYMMGNCTAWANAIHFLVCHREGFDLGTMAVFVPREDSAVERKIVLIFRATYCCVVWCGTFFLG